MALTFPRRVWLDTCRFHLHFLLRWYPSSMPSGPQLITHTANYILFLVWQEQRRMIIVEKVVLFVFLITKYLKSPNPCLGLIHSNISSCNLRGISRLGYAFGGIVSVSLTDPGLWVSEFRHLSTEAVARIQEGVGDEDKMLGWWRHSAKKMWMDIPASVRCF